LVCQFSFTGPGLAIIPESQACTVLLACLYSQPVP